MAHLVVAPAVAVARGEVLVVEAPVFADLLDRYRLVFADLGDDAALDAVRSLMRGFERLAGSSLSADWTYRPTVAAT